jgi:quercetin dioxygenase-like cupin family protein
VNLSRKRSTKWSNWFALPGSFHAKTSHRAIKWSENSEESAVTQRKSKEVTSDPPPPRLWRGKRVTAGEGIRSKKGIKMEIKKSGSQPSNKGPADWFTGTVRIDPLFEAPAPARVRGASVTFEPGARTAWHTHPLGQTLIVTSGLGWAQRWDGEVQELKLGDVVWFPPNEKHWHGATPTTAMSHIAVQEALDGKVVEWLEHVSDQQYRKESRK